MGKGRVLLQDPDCELSADYGSSSHKKPASVMYSITCWVEKCAVMRRRTLSQSSVSMDHLPSCTSWSSRGDMRLISFGVLMLVLKMSTCMCKVFIKLAGRCLVLCNAASARSLRNRNVG